MVLVRPFAAVGCYLAEFLLLLVGFVNLANGKIHEAAWWIAVEILSGFALYGAGSLILKKINKPDETKNTIIKKPTRPANRVKVNKFKNLKYGLGLF